jgi:hypothetical protein
MDAALKLVGWVQTASAEKVVALVLVLFMTTSHWSGVVPSDDASDELLRVTPGSVEAVKAPPPVTTIPGGQVATAVCAGPTGNGTSADET